MKNLIVTKDYKDPSLLPVEVVERKGVGHPDSLADALANEVSIAYSRYCLEHFGFILHHNVDKLYIGAGHYKNGFGYFDRLDPIRVCTNGRMSNSFGEELINIEKIQINAIKKYLYGVLPRLSDDDLVIIPNATQHTKVSNWFTPISRSDVPDSIEPRANDTSFCVAHWPPTPVEMMVYRLERYFWEEKNGLAIPKFPEIGQDIKVLAVRRGDYIEATLCVPTISTLTTSYNHYQQILNGYEIALTEIASQIADEYSLKVSVRINPNQHLYMLGIGSCIECGEEGMVGRGNYINGIISSHSVHTQESWAGKNPVYHTGRVMGYLTAKLARVISKALNVKCTVSVMTKCGDLLFPPHMIDVAVDCKSLNTIKIQSLIDEHILSANYVEEILSFRPWLMKL